MWRWPTRPLALARGPKSVVAKDISVPHRKFSVDASEYPFASHWFERNGCAMHYVDEGGDAADKIAVVMCHGNPTWSYLYRHIIKKLSPQFRCIAADYPGFGFSGHPAGYGYTPQEHVQWMEALLFEHLKLDKFIIVGQDWGGPISMSIATSRPDKILGCVISSTWAWKTNWNGKTFSALMGSGIGQHLILKRNFFATTIIATMLGKTASATTLKAYVDPFQTPESRKGPAVFPVQIVAVTPWRCWRGSDSSGFDLRVSVAIRVITRAASSMGCSRSASPRVWPSTPLTTQLQQPARAQRHRTRASTEPRGAPRAATINSPPTMPRFLMKFCNSWRELPPS